MAYRYTGRAVVNPTNPRAFGVCDRCGFWNQLDRLVYQHEWRGMRLMNLRIRVCDRCLDRPAAFLKPLILPPDPVPVLDPRPQNFSVVGPTVIVPQPIPIYLLDDVGNIVTNDIGQALVTDDSPPVPPDPPVYPNPPPPPLPWPMQPLGPIAAGVPAIPFYITSSQPPLPPEIEEGGFSEP